MILNDISDTNQPFVRSIPSSQPTMGLPRATNFGAGGENSSGQLAGFNHISYDYYTATIWSNGVPIDIGNSTNDDNETIATDVNNFGQVVGFGDKAGYFSTAFLWENGNVYDLNSLVNNLGNWHLEYATGINDHGWIIGGMFDYTLSGEDYTFLLTPDVNVSAVPEPAEVWMFGAGLAVLGFATRKKSQLKTAAIKVS